MITKRPRVSPRERKRKRGRKGEREKLDDGERVSKEEVSCWGPLAGALLLTKMVDTREGFIAGEGNKKEMSSLSFLL